MSALVRGGEPLPGAAVGRETLSEVPDALVPRVLGQLVTEAEGTQLLLHVARDDRRLEALAEGLAFYAPQVRLIAFPAWDTVPYDRIGPNSEIVARRMAALARLAAAPLRGPTLLLTTVNAILQRVPARQFIRRSLKNIAAGQRIDRNELIGRLDLLGYQRTGLVVEAGEYAVRGGILDLYPPGRQSPVRLDFFGDTVEHIKAFDPETQRTGRIVQRLTVLGRRPSGTSAPPTSPPSVRPPPTMRSMPRSAPGSVTPAWSIGWRCSTSGWRACSTTSPARP
jgi:transcription-repair coupling factor (superfamily II helicase)